MAHVLIIEPDRLLAQIYARALQHAGHEVRACTTAQGAVQLADEKQPDVVLLELQLVAHGGVEFLYEFRSYPDWQNIPVIIHSIVPPGEFNDSVQMLRQRLRISEYLYKPNTNLKTLLQTIDAALAPAA